MSFLEDMPLPISYIITHDWKYIHGKMSWTNMFLHDMLSMLFILKGRDFVSSGPGWHISHMSYQKKHLVFHCTVYLIRDCFNGLLKTLYNWVVLSPVYHNNHVFFIALYIEGGSARSCFNASSQSSRIPCSESGALRPAGLFYEWRMVSLWVGMVCFSKFGWLRFPTHKTPVIRPLVFQLYVFNGENWTSRDFHIVYLLDLNAFLVRNPPFDQATHPFEFILWIP